MPRRFHDDDRDDDDRDEERPRRRRREEDDREDGYDEYDDRRSRRRRDDDDREDDDRDRRGRRYAEPPSNGAATTSMILGILSFVGGVTAIPGLICGFAGLSKAKRLGGAGKGMAVTGTALSGVGLVVLALTIWLVIWWVGKQGESRERMIVSNNLKQIGLAMHNHHDATMTLNTGVARSPLDFNNRNPIPESVLSGKLSWRVEMLPYIEQDLVYRQMNMSEPWDGPTNRRHADTPISQYSDVDARSDPATRWRTFYGPGTPFDPANPQRMTLMSVMDGTSNTIFVAEAGEKVTWSKFGEIKFDPRNPPVGSSFGRSNRPTFMVGLFDGSVREVRKSVSPQTLSAAITHQGGEMLGSDW